MAHIKYTDSTYHFTDPVRFFKANDPYYFEVDNIPLKQLQENCLWLKDQLQRDSSDEEGGINRKEIDELRPYTTGLDRTIRVKPGRFTARINDVSKEPLAYLTKVLGDQLGDTNVWQSELPMAGNPVLLNTLDKFKSIVASDALGMDGLAERAFTWPMVDENNPVNLTGVVMKPDWYYLRYDDSTPPLNSPGAGSWVSPTVITEALTWSRGMPGQQEFVTITNIGQAGNGSVVAPAAESHFIKKWRGVTRLAIVDVDTELTVDVPPWDDNDFQYMDKEGNNILIPGVESRIDLVFIYSKPIDSSSVNLMNQNSVGTITKPQLGIVQGAGIKVAYREGSPTDAQNNFWNRRETGSRHESLASPGDQFNTDMGFTATSGNDIAFDVRGSFPAPDDILNIAPLLSEKLESNAYELLGQSILPVAYIWVQKTGGTDTAGNTLIAKTDIIDIRPLFRTAELAYNERAGIAAALPQISLANPVVSRVNLDNEIKETMDYVDNALGGSTGGGFGVDANMEVISAGYIFGGFFFGPEGALWDFAGGDANAKQSVCDSYFGVNAKTNSINNLAVPDKPDWDVAEWTNFGTTSIGQYPNDYINTYISSNSTNGSKATAGLATDRTIIGSSFRVGVDANGDPLADGISAPRLGAYDSADNATTIGLPNPWVPANRVSFHYIKKKISFSGKRPSWLYDYDIDIKFINCLPQSWSGKASPQGIIDTEVHQPGAYTGYWVEKHDEDFTIYLAFTARNTVPHTNDVYAYYNWEFVPDKQGARLPHQQRQGGTFSSFVVPVESMMTKNMSTPRATYGYKGNPQMGMCTYPTIQWKMTGISTQDAPFYFNVNLGADNTIEIKQ